MEANGSIECWSERFDAVVAELDALPLGEVQARCVIGRAKLDAVEVRRLAAEIGADGDDTRARRQARAGGSRSKGAARKAAARAKAVAKNSALGDALATGELSEEKLDTIADAMETDESAATDTAFHDKVKKSSVDAGKKLAKERKNRNRDGESFQERQRRLRRAQRWDDKASGCAAITLTGDDATVQELWNLIRLREKQLRSGDGGRDLPFGQHPRTYDQRLFDAAAELIQGDSGLGARPSTMLLVPVDGSDPKIAGGGPVSDTYARELLARSDLSVMLIDSITSQPLWLGRNNRHTSSAQFLALVARDQGCVLCDAHWIGCEAHHRIPWNAPLSGETNIDDLALVCTGCHHHVHAAKLTLERLDDGTWKTRPATPDELPIHDRDPQAPPHRQRNARQQPQPAAPASAPTHDHQAKTHNPSLHPKPGGHHQTTNDNDSADQTPTTPRAAPELRAVRATPREAGRQAGCGLEFCEFARPARRRRASAETSLH